MSKSKSASEQGACPPTFEDSLTRLDTIVHALEDGQLGLAESMAAYEEGVQLLKTCHGLLENAERKIELLTGVDAAGNPIVRPFDDEASLSLDEKGKPRSRRRSAEREAPTKSPTAPDPELGMDGPRGLF